MREIAPFSRNIQGGVIVDFVSPLEVSRFFFYNLLFHFTQEIHLHMSSASLLLQFSLR